MSYWIFFSYRLFTILNDLHSLFLYFSYSILHDLAHYLFLYPSKIRYLLTLQCTMLIFFNVKRIYIMCQMTPIHTCMHLNFVKRNLKIFWNKIFIVPYRPVARPIRLVVLNATCSKLQFLEKSSGKNLTKNEEKRKNTQFLRTATKYIKSFPTKRRRKNFII